MSANISLAVLIITRLHLYLRRHHHYHGALQIKYQPWHPSKTLPLSLFFDLSDLRFVFRDLRFVIRDFSPHRSMSVHECVSDGDFRS